MEIQRISNERSAWKALLEDWGDKKVAALKESWECSHSWKFYINQASIGMAGGDATQDHLAYNTKDK